MTPPPATCLDCGLPYYEFGADTVLQRSQWLLIHPAEDGLLCANCIIQRASKIPGFISGVLVLEFAPGGGNG